MYLKSQLMLVFAALLGYLDTNDNLDLVKNAVPWKRKFWMDLLSDHQITFYPYTELQTLTHIPVAQTGYENRKFIAQLPFSWIIKGQIEKLLHEHGNTKGT